jgi:hypothetical protein
LQQCVKRLEDVLQESTPSKPTPFDIFCQKKLAEFRQFLAMEISRSAPIKPKLNKLVDMIVALHTPGCRGNISKKYL